MGKSNKSKEKVKNKKIIVIVGILLFLLIGVIIYNIVFNNPNDIKKVKRILSEKYSDISCIDSSCNGFVVIDGDKLKEIKVILYNDKGKKVASYKEKYNEKAKTKKEPYQLSNNYFIMRTINKNDSSIKSYSVYGTNGKELYTTKNRLQALNDKYILMKEKDDNYYSIIDKKGEKIYSNIKEFEEYDNGKFILLKIDDDSILLDENANRILSGYTIKKEGIDEDGKLVYFILKDIKNSVYNYYNVKKKKIIGDSFENYTKEVNTTNLIITKTETSKKVKYRLLINGKQEKIEDEFVQVEEVSKIKEKIDSKKYYLYTSSIYKNNQKDVLVDNLKSKSIGILNIDSNKYKEIYKYNEKATNTYSMITKLNSDSDKLYLQITCNASMCEKQRVVVYDFDNKKELYKLEDKDLVAQNYTEYEDNYKVVRYAYSSTNKDYKGKYVLYDKNNKELLKSSNEILIIDKDVLFGKTGTSSLVLYSVKDKKQLNDKEASIITVSNEEFYKYINDKDETIIASLKGKELLTVPKDSYIKYSNDMIIYLDNKYVKMFDVKTKGTRKYKLKQNEKLNDGLGEIIPPFRGAIFVNNSTDKYVKILDSNTKLIKKIKGSEISSVGTMNNGDIYIITKTINKNGNQYGLYIAK